MAGQMLGENFPFAGGLFGYLFQEGGQVAADFGAPGSELVGSVQQVLLEVINGHGTGGVHEVKEIFLGIGLGLFEDGRPGADEVLAW